MKYYLASAILESEDQSEIFIKESKWTGYGSEKIVNRVAINDVLILANEKKEIICIGQCTKNKNDGETLEVKWCSNFTPFQLDDETIDKFVSTINQINKDSFIKNILKQAKHKNSIELENLFSKKIKTLEIDNFKIFYEKETLNFEEKNVLIYGENGSGKSSIVKALKSLFQASIEENYTNKFNNIFQDEKNDFEIKITLNDDSQYSFNSDNKNYENILKNIAYSFPFLEFKDILQIYFDDIINLETQNQQKNLFPLFSKLLKNYPTNLQTQTSQPKKLGDWDFGTPYFKELLKIIENLRGKSNEYLKTYFKESLKILPYSYDIARNEITMNIQYHKQNISFYKEILNEAKLSSLAMSIYFLMIQELCQKYDNHLKILVLDDLLISLDMHHRLPILEILEQEFNRYQIIFLTHDKALFEVFKNRTDSKQWKYFEVYADTKKVNYSDEEIEIEVPLIIEGQEPLEKAKRYCRERLCLLCHLSTKRIRKNLR